ncbi:hypothetical protein [Conexibacter sp. CPCC 206217]|uniref:hypothetical protein n=1 Tax=Conexibacter sp. CPCC 206217 TaxID=3064574 RepID=UPI00271B62A6|nr:hypothetical protein [Conexibacter sp. CPCC 206217]MDO8209280.1 hypothetical protein [Conexibacter sp. CPCC 206217]
MRRLYDDKDRFAVVALAISFVALGAGFGALAYTAASNADRADEIQRSRYDATLRSCRSRNEDRANIAIRVQPRPPFTAADLARDFGPIAHDCARYAREQVRVR